MRPAPDLASAAASPGEADRRSRLPSVDAVLREARGRLALARFGRPAAVAAVRAALEAARTAAAEGAPVVSAEALAGSAWERLEAADAPSLCPVFNLTGTVLHTNLGRALLAESAVAAAEAAMRGAVALEFEVEGGRRGERDDHVRGLLRELTGAEDALVVNNNAAAVLLLLNGLAAGRETLVSRGELIEIGGSFRMPDIMAGAGTRLVEVGTTNRTHLRDYAAAIGPETALLLKVHTSNYLIHGFTAAVPAAELAGLARERGLVLAEDLGSGTLLDLGRYGLRAEPTVQEALRAGVDLVTFSGDKLLGGPQAGILAGRAELVRRLAKNPMKRALRLDKLRLAALEATLKLYRDPDRLPETLPSLRHFTRPAAEIEAQARRLEAGVAQAVGEGFRVSVAACASQIGSGALPLETLRSSGLAVRPLGRAGAGRRVEGLAAAFRRLPMPVVGRIEDGALLLDLRCLDDEAGFLAQLSLLRPNEGGGDARLSQA